MYILPAIDILEGKAVRLSGGDFAKATVYNDDPALQAQLFEEAGAEWLHVVDLDGARSGAAVNEGVIRAILERTSLHVEVGGGIRDLESAKRMLDTGVDRVILGTALVKDPDEAKRILAELGAPSVVCGIDAKAGDVKVEGWVEGAELDALELASAMAAAGFEHLFYTDIARDGMRTGISSAAYVEMRNAFDNPVIASGGIAELSDIEELMRVSDAIEGVIVGRALYEGSLSLSDAIAACKQTLSVEPGFLGSLEEPLVVTLPIEGTDDAD